MFSNWGKRWRVPDLLTLMPSGHFIIVTAAAWEETNLPTIGTLKITAWPRMYVDDSCALLILCTVDYAIIYHRRLNMTHVPSGKVITLKLHPRLTYKNKYSNMYIADKKISLSLPFSLSPSYYGFISRKRITHI